MNIELPEEVTEFARGVHALAKKYKIDKCTVEMRPDWEVANKIGGDGLRAWGNIILILDTTDGRGRPNQRIKVCFNPTVECSIDG